MMNRRRFLQIGATTVLAISANRFAFAAGDSKVSYVSLAQRIFTVF